MQLIDHLASGSLMETVDVLGDHGLELSRLFQLRQFPVGGVGLRPWMSIFPDKTGRIPRGFGQRRSD